MLCLCHPGMLKKQTNPALYASWSIHLARDKQVKPQWREYAGSLMAALFASSLPRTLALSHSLPRPEQSFARLPLWPQITATRRKQVASRKKAAPNLVSIP